MITPARLTTICTFLVLLSAAACSGGSDSDRSQVLPSPHGCTGYSADGEWEFMEIYMIHNQPEQCPVFIYNRGDPVRFSADVEVVAHPSNPIGPFVKFQAFTGQSAEEIMDLNFYYTDLGGNRFMFQPTTDYDAGTQANSDIVKLGLIVLYLGDEWAEAQLTITVDIDCVNNNTC
jgi:hypothetical protein